MKQQNTSLEACIRFQARYDAKHGGYDTAQKDMVTFQAYHKRRMAVFHRYERIYAYSRGQQR